MATHPPHAPDALDQLRELIEADGRPLGEIAESAGISRNHLYQVRSGVRRDPSLSTVAKILGSLGKDWPDLKSPA